MRGHPPTIGRSFPAALLLLFLLASVPQVALAQQGEAPDSVATLAGKVVSAMTGGPLEDVRVMLKRSQRGAFTDEEGRFRIDDVPAGRDTVEVQLIGFATESAPLTLEAGHTTRAVFSLSKTVLQIEDIEVTVKQERVSGRLTGFRERQQLGHGAFVGPEDIDESSAVHSSDLLRMVPGVTVGADRVGRTSIRINRYQRMCRPYVFLDGMPMGEYHIDNLRPNDVLAIEVYRGPSETPARFKKRGGQCGTMVIWTREGKDGERGG